MVARVIHLGMSAGGGGAPATTWSTSDLSNVTVSGSDLTAAISTNAYGSVRSVAATVANQLVYIEHTITNLGGGNAIALGFSTAATALSGGLPGMTSPSTAFYLGNGGVFFCADSANHFANVTSSFVTGDTVDCAFNTLLGKAWFRVNNAAWNNLLSTQDPATGAGGLSVPFAGPYFAIFNGDWTPVIATTAFAEATPWARTKPTGYSQLAA